MPIDGAFLLNELNTNPESFLKRVRNKSVKRLEFDFTKIIEDNLNDFNDKLISITLHEISDILRNIYDKNKKVSSNVIKDLRFRYNGRIISKCYKVPPHWLKDFLQCLDNLGQDSKQYSEEILDYITKEENNYYLIQLCLKEKTSLEYLKSFLVYIKDKKPNFLNKIISLMKEDSYKNTLIKRCINCPPNFLINFLKFLDGYESDFSDKIKTELLNKNCNKELIEQKVLNFDIGSYKYFLVYWSNQPKYKDFYEELKQFRFSDEKSKKLVNKILASDISRVQEIFRYMSEEEEPIGKVIKLISGKNMDIFVKNCLNAPLVHLVGLLKYLGDSDEDGKKFLTTLHEELFTQKNITTIQESILVANYNEIAVFLSYLDDMNKVTQDFSMMLIKELKRDENLTKLLRKTINSIKTDKKITYWRGDLNTPLSNLKPFLAYLHKRDRDFFKEYINEIKKEEYVRFIVNHSLNVKVDKMQDFLNFLDELDDLTKTWSSEIKSEYFSKDNMVRLVNNCYKLPINYATSLLKYLSEKRPTLLQGLINSMFGNNFEDLLFVCTKKSGPYQLVSFLKYLDIIDKKKSLSNRLIREIFSSTKYKSYFLESFLNADIEKRRGLYRYLMVIHPPYFKILHQEINNRPLKQPNKITKF